MSSRKKGTGGGRGGGDRRGGGGGGSRKKKGGGSGRAGRSDRGGSSSTKRQADFVKSKNRKGGRSMEDMRSRRNGGKSPGKRGKSSARDKVRERGGAGSRRGGGGGSRGGGSSRGMPKIPKEPKRKKSAMQKLFLKLCGGTSVQLDFTLEPFVSGIRRVGCKTLLHYFSTALTFFPHVHNCHRHSGKSTRLDCKTRKLRNCATRSCRLTTTKVVK